MVTLQLPPRGVCVSDLVGCSGPLQRLNLPSASCRHLSSLIVPVAALGASLSYGLVRSRPKKTLLNSPGACRERSVARLGRRGGRQSFGSHWTNFGRFFPERSEGKSVKVELRDS